MATLVTDILDRAARQASVPLPSNWVTDTTQTIVEMRDWLAETVDDILERVDLPSPITQTTTISGTGAESYSLPTDFKRLTRGPLAVYETAPVRRRVWPVSDAGQWSDMDNYQAFGSQRFYRVTGYDGSHSISLLDEPSTGASFTVHYISTEWLTDGTSDFTATTQYTYLPRRLLESGIVWRARERKGLDFEPKRAEYEMLMARLNNDARGIRVISFGGHEPRSIWDVPLPDTIPSA